MDLVTVGVVLGLMALGAGLVWWPAGLMLAAKDKEIDRLKGLSGAASDLLETERDIDAARDLDPDSELGVLLDGDDPAGPEA